VQLTARQKIFLALAFLVLAGLGAAFWKFFWPQLKVYQDTRVTVEGLRRKFDVIKAKYNYYPNPVKYLDELEPEIAKWEDAYNRRAKVFTATLEKIPVTEKEPGFHFNERWKETRDRLLRKAQQQNVAIPPDIGFGPGIPPVEEVETLLNQLTCTEYILNLALDNGALAISSFAVGQPEETNGFIRMIPFQLGFVASLENVKKFLYECGHGNQYVTVDSLTLRVLREAPGVTNFEAQVALRTTWILDKPAIMISEEEGIPGAPMGFEALFKRMRSGEGAPEGGTRGLRPGR
jgi:hypothetical protein